jgi:GGDEF domain-containing protein
MDALEVSIWSAMAGGLSLMVLVAAADIFKRSSLRSWRGLAFVLVPGLSAVLMTGLPEFLLGMSDARSLLPAKAALGPLASALALTYLGFWLGIVVEDRLIRHTVTWGALALVLSGISVAVWALVDQQRSSQDILRASAAITLVSCVLTAVVAMRGALLGDPLARSMALTCIFLFGMVAGLYTKGLAYEGFGHFVWLLTAICCVAYFLLVTRLTLQRNKALHELQRLARGQQANDAVTGLPTGVSLMVQVDDALWRSSRMKGQTMTVAVWVANLYELSGVAGMYSDVEIRSALAARMRRAVGFRNVVGQYHPRCFVVVVSPVQNEKVLHSGIDRIRKYLSPTLRLGTLSRDDFVFTPQIGFGVVVTQGEDISPSSLLDEAEALAQGAINTPGRVAIRLPGQAKAINWEENSQSWLPAQPSTGISRVKEHAHQWPDTLP